MEELVVAMVQIEVVLFTMMVTMATVVVVIRWHCLEYWPLQTEGSPNPDDKVTPPVQHL